MVGTPAFRDPELHAGSKHYDHRVDFFSLGVMIYEFVTGKIPDKDEFDKETNKTKEGRVNLVDRHFQKSFGKNHTSSRKHWSTFCATLLQHDKEDRSDLYTLKNRLQN